MYLWYDGEAWPKVLETQRTDIDAVYGECTIGGFDDAKEGQCQWALASTSATYDAHLFAWHDVSIDTPKDQLKTRSVTSLVILECETTFRRPVVLGTTRRDDPRCLSIPDKVKNFSLKLEKYHCYLLDDFSVFLNAFDRDDVSFQFAGYSYHHVQYLCYVQPKDYWKKTSDQRTTANIARRTDTYAYEMDKPTSLALIPQSLSRPTTANRPAKKTAQIPMNSTRIASQLQQENIINWLQNLDQRNTS